MKKPKWVRWNRPFLKELSRVSGRNVRTIQQNVVLLVSGLGIPPEKVWDLKKR